jgi:hypothetical protein
MSNSAHTFARAFAIAGLAASLGASDALAAGVFADFGGNWRGSGRISDVNGRSERMSCKSTNSPSYDGIAMSLALVCASDSYRVDFRSELYTDGRALRGTWSEKTRDASGDVQGQIGHDVFNVTATAPGFDANIVVRVVDGKRLDVTLNARGTTINHADVSMRR